MQPIPCLDRAHSAQSANDKKDGERNVTLSVKDSRLILHAREFAEKHRRNFTLISLTLHAHARELHNIKAENSALRNGSSYARVG